MGLETRQSYGSYNWDLTSNLFLIVFLIIIASASIKILREYERGVIFRLGRLIGDTVILPIPVDLLTAFMQKKG